jgi:hypothetical protein
MHALLSAFVALSQPAVAPPAPATEAPPAPATEAPPAWVLPPMPDPNADYSVDAALFTEVSTEPERARRAALEASLRPADRRPPLYARAPALTLLTVHALKPEPQLVFAALMAWLLLGFGAVFFEHGQSDGLAATAVAPQLLGVALGVFGDHAVGCV